MTAPTLIDPMRPQRHSRLTRPSGTRIPGWLGLLFFLLTLAGQEAFAQDYIFTPCDNMTLGITYDRNQNDEPSPQYKNPIRFMVTAPRSVRLAVNLPAGESGYYVLFDNQRYDVTNPNIPITLRANTVYTLEAVAPLCYDPASEDCNKTTRVNIYGDEAPVPSKPLVYTVIGGGTNPTGNTPREISLTGSQVGVNYTLKFNGTAIVTVAGTGAALSLGSHAAAGTYTVEATTAAGCYQAMSGSGVIYPKGTYGKCDPLEDNGSPSSFHVSLSTPNEQGKLDRESPSFTLQTDRWIVFSCNIGKPQGVPGLQIYIKFNEVEYRETVPRTRMFLRAGTYSLFAQSDFTASFAELRADVYDDGVSAGRPTAGAATAVTATNFTANWEAVPGATSYQLDVSTSPAFNSFLPGYQGLTVAGTSHPVTGLTPNTTYYYRVRAVNECSVGGNSDVITVNVPCADIGFAVDFTVVKSVCAYKFTPFFGNPHNAAILSYRWEFGDGNASTLEKPLHVYGSYGTYTASFTVTYQYPGCTNVFTVTKQHPVDYTRTDDVLADEIITVGTELVDEVINATAATFSDTWPLEHATADLNGQNPYLNGARGVWRAEASFAYDELRKPAEAAAGGAIPGPIPVKIATDGTYTLEKFNWDYSDWDVTPKWRRASTVTRYSPYSFELENRDILGRHSAALYDYGGQFPSATGLNMRHQEMAFTGFEYLDGGSSGNWTLTNAATPLYTQFEVVSGRGNYALVRATAAELENVDVVDIEGRSFWFKRRVIVQQNRILCKQPYVPDPNWTLVAFERPVTELPWRGVLIKRNEGTNAVSATFDATVRHSGAQSLKVQSALTLKQDLLRLEPRKAYLVSGWVSINQTSLREPKLGDGLGVDLVFRNRQGGEVQRFTFAPSGRVIEGWQQVTGTFVCPDETALEITFKPRNGGTAWYDDLRLHPVQGNMEAYVYDPVNFRLQATLDENNYAALYYYDEEGRLYLTKKETAEGIKTISETVTHVPDSN